MMESGSVNFRTDSTITAFGGGLSCRGFLKYTNPVVKIKNGYDKVL